MYYYQQVSFISFVVFRDYCENPFSLYCVIVVYGEGAHVYWRGLLMLSTPAWRKGFKKMKHILASLHDLTLHTIVTTYQWKFFRVLVGVRVSTSVWVSLLYMVGTQAQGLAAILLVSSFIKWISRMPNMIFFVYKRTVRLSRKNVLTVLLSSLSQTCTSTSQWVPQMGPECASRSQHCSIHIIVEVPNVFQ